MDEVVQLNFTEKCETQSPNEDDPCIISAESENWPKIDVKKRIVSNAVEIMQLPIEEECVGLPVETILMTDMEGTSEELYKKRAQSQEEASATPVVESILPTVVQNPLEFYRMNDGNSMEVQVHALSPEACRDKNQLDCSVGDKGFVNQPKQNNDLTSFQCDICSKSFQQKSKLIRHYHIHAGKTFTCSVCEKGFTTKDELTKHFRTHTGEQPFSCDVCLKRFSQKCNLNTHYRVHTKEKPYVCEICNKCFSHKNRLATHGLVHTNEKSFECEICHTFFNQMSNLMQHYRVHTQEKPFECEMCHKNFSKRSSLKRHYRIHSGLKPHECEICHKRFGERCTLTEHMRVHTKEKPYKCDLCDRHFRKQDHLAKHRRIHTKEKPYVCDACPRSFSRREYLTSHYCEGVREQNSSDVTSTDNGTSADFPPSESMSPIADSEPIPEIANSSITVS